METYTKDPDWQRKIKFQNILPAVPTATEFKLGTKRRCVDLRTWDGLMTSYRVISWYHVANNNQQWK